ncbi:DNA-directed RNA polymerase III subunit 22.9 kDa polypeptide [Sodiomyces alkalinus F11]|uniref:DNA-directed RNA polymerase subunit n=1 Tax=Sodiomyces alkalinus (strain CBS 110278 / VKM F-3762 / F11) TaxID=1314773 RepID=A0A3N2PM35_SODAK|nr:DNA-directed RNA polymerase III subunit 22.9 kDa polypeptide [Sodiomyces alkalinus F11]ROT35595.1 DNA-directed RNA polymerase III subunit 22.9 kDa polypeptide [Sodiomyces alkalinus F11]
MFILTKVADLVQIAPDDFKKKSIVAIEDYINAKYANKVIQKIGLCISLYDLLWASEGLIGHGTGLVNVNVEFRIIVFRPFKGEVMFGRIRSSTPSGINVRTDFFDDIFVPFDELPEGAEYNHQEQLWIWNCDEETRLYYDNHEMVRFQVIDEEWHDQTPAGPNQNEEDALQAPYRIKGSMAMDGLGVCLWWDGDEGEEGGEGEEG